MSGKPKTKTVLEIAGIEGASDPDELRTAICNTHCIGQCPTGTCSKITEKWVSEVEYARQGEEFGKQNEALAKVCGDLKDEIGVLEGRLEAIKQHYEKMPKCETCPSLQKDVANDLTECSNYEEGDFCLCLPIMKWREGLGVLLALDQPKNEAKKQ